MDLKERLIIEGNTGYPSRSSQGDMDEKECVAVFVT
jgi:hypothetical protein